MTRRERILAVAGAALMLPMLICAPPPAWADNVRDGQWHLTSLRIGEAQKLSMGRGVIVGVVDSGVDADHVDLAGNVLPGADFTSPIGGNGWTDLVGHGTAVASLISGHGHGASHGALGMAPAAKILPVRRQAVSERGAEIGQGIQWAADHGARVVNVSIDATDTPALRRAVDYALSKDVVIVAGVGLPGGLGDVAAPARLPGVVAVSGIDQAGNIANVSVTGPEVAIAAPAIDIWHATKDGGYSPGDGTSYATAIVSGVVALIRSKYPDLDAANVINRLIRTADDKGPPGRDEGYGFGIVNPVRALTADVPMVDRNPLLQTPTSATASSRSQAAASPSHAPPLAAHAKSASPWIGVGAGLAILLTLGAVVLLLLRNARTSRGKSYVK